MTAHASEEVMAVKKYTLLLDLWKSEARSQLDQFMVLLAVNALLVLAFFLAEKTPWVALAGCLISLVFLLPLGQSVRMRAHWRLQMDLLSRRGPGYALLQTHRLGGRPSLWAWVPPRWYLLGTPILAAICWLAVLYYLLLT